MAGFDPDAFLAKHAPVGATGGFDPDAFLQKHGGAPEPPVVQEMHPDLTAADRLIVKNFATDNEAAVNYLQKQHPDLEIKVGAGDQILARKRDGSETAYRTLDPKTGILGTLTNPKELALTLGGAGYDIGSGVASTAAGAAAGLGLGGLSAGIGALPAASAASGATNAGLELLRQKIGNALGIDQDTSYGHLAAAGIGGAVSPLLFGTGASAANIAARAAETGVEPAALAAAQKGIPGTLLAKLGSMTSNIPQAAIAKFAADPSKITALATPEAQEQYIVGATKGIGDKLREVKNAANDAFRSELGGAADAPIINLDSVAQPWKKEMAHWQAVVDANPGQRSFAETLGALRDKFEQYFSKTEKVEQAGPKISTGILDATGNPIMTNGPSIMHHVPGELDVVNPVTADELGRNLASEAKFSSLAPNRIQGGVGNRLANNLTRSDQVIQNVAAESKKALEDQMAAVLPPEAIAAKGQLAQAINDEKALKGLLKTTKTADKTFRNAGNLNNKMDLARLDSIDKRYGSNLIDTAQTLEASKYFNKPSALAYSMGNNSGLSHHVPAAFLGAGLGYKAGEHEGPGGGTVGALIGGALGGALGGPAAIRNYILAATRAKSLIPGALQNAASSPLTQAGINSAWNMMQGGPQ